MSETTTVESTNSITQKLSSEPSNVAESAEVPDKLAVGWLFVQQYYTFLNEKPHKLHLFYTKDSNMCHGIEGQSVTTYYGQAQIIQRIKEHHFNNCKVLISNMDCQASTNGGVVVQVLGEMFNNGGPSQKFVQTFFLARQTKGYFVLNDIFRIFKEDVDDDEETGPQFAAPAAPVSQGTTPVPEEAPIASYPSTASAETRPLSNDTIPPSTAATSTDSIVPPVAVVAPAAPANTEVNVKYAAAAKPASTPKEKPFTNEPASTPAVNGGVVEESVKPAPVEESKPSAPVSWASMAARKKDSESNGHVVTPVAYHTVHHTEAKPASHASSIIVTTRPGQYPGRRTQEYHSAYIRNVSVKVDDELLRKGLENIGQLTHFQVEKAKNCAFVDFIDEATLKAALAVHELKVGDQTVLIEERKRGGAKNKNFQKKNGNVNAKNKK